MCICSLVTSLLILHDVLLKSSDTVSIKLVKGEMHHSHVEWTGHMGYGVRDNYALTVLGHGVILHQGQTSPVFMWWSDLTGCILVFKQHMPVFLTTLCVNKDGNIVPMVLARVEPHKRLLYEWTHTSRGQHLWPEATEEPAQLGHLSVPLSQAVSLVQVSSIGSSVSGL